MTTQTCPHPLDLTLVEEIAGGDAEARNCIIADFQRVNDADAAALRAAAARADAATVTRRAHRMKGACLMVGAGALVDVCGRIEAASHEGRNYLHLLGNLDFELAHLGRFVDQLVGSAADLVPA